MKNKENHAPSHPRVVVRPSLTPPWRFVSVQTAKECKSSWQRSGRGAERKGGGEESNVRINLYSLQLHPVFCADFRGSGWENTALFAKPQQCKSFRASSCLYVWTRVGQCTVRTTAGERKKGRYASLDIIGKKGEKMDAYIWLVLLWTCSDGSPFLALPSLCFTYVHILG